jgi:hypothetical protein
MSSFWIFGFGASDLFRTRLPAGRFRASDFVFNERQNVHQSRIATLGSKEKMKEEAK